MCLIHWVDRFLMREERGSVGAIQGGGGAAHLDGKCTGESKLHPIHGGHPFSMWENKQFYLMTGDRCGRLPVDCMDEEVRNYSGRYHSTSTWAVAIRDYNHPDYADTNAPLTFKIPKAQRFLDKLLPNPLDHKDPTKVVQLLRDFLNDTRRLKRNEKSMSFKKQEFDFLDSAVDHLSSLLSSPDRIGIEVQKSVSTLKGQVADLKEAVTALTAAVNPSTLGAKTAESMASHLSKLHGKPDAKHLSSIIPHSVSHQPQPQKSQNASNEDVQLTLTWKTPELLDISSPLDELLEEGTIPKCNLIKEEPRKIVATFNDIFRTKNIPSEVYEKTPREERIAAKMKPHLRIRAAQRLKSGDLRLHFYYASEVQLAIESQEVWLPHLESGWSIKCKTYPTIVHAVPSSFGIDNPEEVRSRIEPFNLNLCDHILKMNWCRTKKQAASSEEKAKTHSSLILVVDHSLTADALIEFGLVIDGKAYTVENLATPSRGARPLSPVEYAPVPILRNLVHSPARIPIHAVTCKTAPIDL
ncbi:hypothetical protein BT69DRAFT_1294871 [Atractiella rhizophila]|nr:hypothetical protein BT69DRAFT_1294871 [Atractiella rhizophila]